MRVYLVTFSSQSPFHVRLPCDTRCMRNSDVGYTSTVLAHGVAGGVMSSLEGGKFGSGFIGAGVSEAFSGATAHMDARTLGVSADRAVTAAIIGGTASAISGGKFSDGAISGAFGQIYSDAANGAAMNQRMQTIVDNSPQVSDIIVLNDPNAVNVPFLGTMGHNAEIIGSDQTGWVYVSKNGGDSNTMQAFPTLADFSSNDLSSRYDRGLQIAAPATYDQAMISFASSTYQQPYDWMNNNCAVLVTNTLSAGGFTMGGAINLSYIPNVQFIQIQNEIGGTYMSPVHH